MKLETLDDLLLNILKDLYSAETMIVEKGLPAMINKSEGKLEEALEKHLEETKGQIERLKKAAEILDKKLLAINVWVWKESLKKEKNI